MNLVQRVRNLLLSPQSEWQAIAAESGTVGDIYARYLVYLAAIPAVAGFIGMSLLGVGGFGITVRVPLMAGLVQMVLSYALSLAMVYVLALVVDALAASFGGRPDRLSAFKVAAYGMTASLVAGIFSLVPSLAVLGLVGAAWSVWLLFLGLPVLMRNAPDKTVAYTAVVVVVGIVASVVVAAAVGMLMPAAALVGGSGSAAVVLQAR